MSLPRHPGRPVSSGAKIQSAVHLAWCDKWGLCYAIGSKFLLPKAQVAYRARHFQMSACCRGVQCARRRVAAERRLTTSAMCASAKDRDFGGIQPDTIKGRRETFSHACNLDLVTAFLIALPTPLDWRLLGMGSIPVPGSLYLFRNGRRRDTSQTGSSTDARRCVIVVVWDTDPLPACTPLVHINKSCPFHFIKAPSP